MTSEKSDRSKGGSRPSRNTPLGAKGIDLGTPGYAYVENAAELIRLTSSDFVRLAISQALGNIFQTAFDAAAERAFRLFRKKVQGLFNRRFDRIRFDDDNTQSKLLCLELNQTDLESLSRPHNFVVVRPQAGYPGLIHSAGDSYYPSSVTHLLEAVTEEPDVAARPYRALHDVWDVESFKNAPLPNPSMAPRDFARALHAQMLAAVGFNSGANDKSERDRSKRFVMSYLDRWIVFEFYALKTRYRAVPGLLAAIYKVIFPLPPEISSVIRNDPVALHQFLTWSQSPHTDSPRPYNQYLLSLWPKQFEPHVYEEFIRSPEPTSEKPAFASN